MGYYYEYENKIKDIRILPNTPNISFNNLDEFKVFIETVLTSTERNGKYYFPTQMMRCPLPTLVLFQYEAQVRAVGIMIDRVKEASIRPNGEEYKGYYVFDTNSLLWLDMSIDKETMQIIYPEFANYGRKQQVDIKFLHNIITFIENHTSPENIIEDLQYEIDQIEHTGLKGEDKEILSKQRIGQGLFRDLLSKRYNKCAISSCRVHSLQFLRASHIKPWSVCSSEEKVDVNNGLLICPNHDLLFDKGYISFNNDGSIIISEKIDEIDRMFLNINDQMKIDITEENKKYLDYHRQEIFDKY